MKKPITLLEIHSFKGKYPPQLWFLFLVEMWERFTFYGMRGMLVIFMVERLRMNESEANLKYGATQAFVYTMAFVGGFFADKILGFRKSVFWGGLLMILGSTILACSPEDWFFTGISFIIVGTGFFKPNISTMVGELYKEGDPRRDAGFGLFYSGINLGAFLGGLLCMMAANRYSWNLAFGLAGFFMLGGLLLFLFTQKFLGQIGQSPLLHKSKKERRLKEGMVFLGSLAILPCILLLVQNTRFTDIFLWTIGPLSLAYLIWETFKLPRAERRRMLAAFILIFFSIIFWAFFEQSGGSLSLFSRHNLRPELFSFTVNPNEVNNSINSLFVIMFSPLAGLLWLAMGRKGKEPSDAYKFGFGFIFLALGFFLFYSMRNFADSAGTINLNIFVLAYFALTLGELCLSPIGLSLMTKLSPKPLWGMMMGFWFLASAYGQYAAGIIGAGMTVPEAGASLYQKMLAYTEGYRQLAWVAVFAGILLLLLAPMLGKLMKAEPPKDHVEHA